MFSCFGAGRVDVNGATCELHPQDTVNDVRETGMSTAAVLQRWVGATQGDALVLWEFMRDTTRLNTTSASSFAVVFLPRGMYPAGGVHEEDVAV